MTTILFAEDEPVLGQLVKEALEYDGHFNVQWCKNGNDALQIFTMGVPDICIFDVMMPGMDGFKLATAIRKIDANVPILFLTARSQTADVITGFEAGGNDYLKKPFSIEELLLRVKELLKRSVKYKNSIEPLDNIYQIGSYHFNPTTQVLQCPHATYALSGRENELLRELVLHKNSLMARNATLIKLWGDDHFFNARNMDVYIARLRKYLQHDPSISLINIRGQGFKLIEM